MMPSPPSEGDLQPRRHQIQSPAIFSGFFIRSIHPLLPPAGERGGSDRNRDFASAGRMVSESRRGSVLPDDLPVPQVPAVSYPQVLHPTAASANVSKVIWDMYFNDLLPLITSKGDDGCYAFTATLDLVCLQAVYKRIHYGKFVAGVKFRDAPEDYSTAVRSQDALVKMRTFVKVEEMVKKRVEKKAMVFGWLRKGWRRRLWCLARM